MITIYGLSSIECNDIRYVGMTHGSVFDRFKEHLQCANRNDYRSKYPVYDWIRKHNNNISYTILQKDASAEDEEKWIQHFKSLGHNILNLAHGGTAPNIGRKFSNESSDKKAYFNLHNRGKKVICITTGKIFDGIGLAAKEYGFNNDWVYNSCKHRYSDKTKYVFEYLNEKDRPIKERPKKENKLVGLERYRLENTKGKGK